MVTSSSVPRLSGTLVARVHEAKQALDAVVDIAERPGLLAVAPDLDRPAWLGHGHLAAQRGRSLLASTLVGSERAVDVVEPHDPDIEVGFLGVVGAGLLGDELLPAVRVLGLGRKGVLFLQREDVGVGLPILGIDAGRRRVEIPLDAVLPGRLQACGD